MVPEKPPWKNRPEKTDPVKSPWKNRPGEKIPENPLCVTKRAENLPAGLNREVKSMGQIYQAWPTKATTLKFPWPGPNLVWTRGQVLAKIYVKPVLRYLKIIYVK
jgi:hypothetical protein